MAAAQERTEKPTAKRRSEARKRGQVAKSADLNGATVLIAGLLAVVMMSGRIVSSVSGVMTGVFSQVANPGSVASAGGLESLVHEALGALVGTVVPIFAICIGAAIAINVLQTGGRPSMHALKPDFKRINPASGARNIFGSRIVFEAGKSLAKVSVVGGVVALALVPDITHVRAAVGTPPAALAALLHSGVTGIAERAAAGYLLIGIVDYVYQRRRNEKSLKMTKQEIREEGKQHQLPPEVRAALRRRQLQQARARMMAAVPKADVVVTNPTHYAVALQYSGEQPAPIVVAKGTDLVALQIRRIAEEHDIPIVPDPPLARELHRVVELDQMIPAELYEAVAHVLAFVYRLAARKRVGV